MVQSLAMCLRPPTPKSLTKPASYGVIDPSKRVTLAELERQDRLWQVKQGRKAKQIEQQQQQQRALRTSFDSQMTRVGA